jgi:hypothetical protein
MRHEYKGYVIDIFPDEDNAACCNFALITPEGVKYQVFYANGEDVVLRSVKDLIDQQEDERNPLDLIDLMYGTRGAIKLKGDKLRVSYEKNEGEVK